jgi:dTDP-4-dehydrorhamnose 3,5-epimerase-like enzyme
MAHIINLPTFEDERGKLTVVEELLPFKIRRLYYIYDAVSKRGGHRHKKTMQALITLGGSCDIYVNNGKKEEVVVLNSPKKCLILEPRDWHTMDNFSKGTVLLVLSSEYYNVHDYIDEKY